VQVVRVRRVSEHFAAFHTAFAADGKENSDSSAPTPALTLIQHVAFPFQIQPNISYFDHTVSAAVSWPLRDGRPLTRPAALAQTAATAHFIRHIERVSLLMLRAALHQQPRLPIYFLLPSDFPDTDGRVTPIILLRMRCGHVSFVARRLAGPALMCALHCQHIHCNSLQFVTLFQVSRACV
jgi:hypothetical protein